MPRVQDFLKHKKQVEDYKLTVGHLIYTRQFKVDSRDDSAAIALPKGHAMAIVVGYCRDNVPQPTEKIIWQLLGQAGLISFDFVGEILGDEAKQKIVSEFIKKYRGDANEKDASVQAEQVPGGPKI